MGNIVRSTPSICLVWFFATAMSQLTSITAEKPTIARTCCLIILLSRLIKLTQTTDHRWNRDRIFLKILYLTNASLNFTSLTTAEFVPLSKTVTTGGHSLTVQVLTTKPENDRQSTSWSAHEYQISAEITKNPALTNHRGRICYWALCGRG